MELRKSMKLDAALGYMNLSKSSYSYENRPRSEDRRIFPLAADLEKALKDMSGYELTLGYDKTTDYLRWKHDRIWNRKKVYRHMSVLKMLQPRSIKRIWIKNRRLGKSQASQSNRRWEADMTYVPTQMGNMYLFVIEDIHDKEVVGGHMDIRCGAQQAVEALKQALIKRFGCESACGLELIVRVDRGCQFTAEDFAQFAVSCGIKLEFCGVQTPNDKPYIESFIGCYKREEVYRNQYEDFFEAVEGWKNYLDWYHHRRPHGSLNNLPPVVFKLENSSTKTA
jgi:putative transposase